MQRAYARRRGWLAWHIAALSRTEKMPTLDDLTGEKRNRPAQTPEQMLHAVRMWKHVLKKREGGE